MRMIQACGTLIDRHARFMLAMIAICTVVLFPLSVLTIAILLTKVCK